MIYVFDYNEDHLIITLVPCNCQWVAFFLGENLTNAEVKLGTDINLLSFLTEPWNQVQVFLYPESWADCEVNQTWEKERAEALTRIAEPHRLFTCLCKLWYVYLVTIPRLSYNVSNMKLCPATQYAIIIALTSNEAETLNSLLQGIKWESKNWHTHFKLYHITIAQNPAGYEWNKYTLFITQALVYSHAQHNWYTWQLRKHEWKMCL